MSDFQIFTSEVTKAADQAVKVLNSLYRLSSFDYGRAISVLDRSGIDIADLKKIKTALHLLQIEAERAAEIDIENL